jgi:hypothetical protein
MWLISISFIIIWDSRRTRVRELNGSHVVTWPSEVQCAPSILLSLAPWIPTPTRGQINPSHLTSDVRLSTNNNTSHSYLNITKVDEAIAQCFTLDNFPSLSPCLWRITISIANRAVLASSMWNPWCDGSLLEPLPNGCQRRKNKLVVICFFSMRF